MVTVERETLSREAALETILSGIDFRAVEVANPDKLKVQVGDGGFVVRPTSRTSFILDEESMKPALAFAGIPEKLAKSISAETTAKVMTESLRSSKNGVTILAKDERVIDLVPAGNYQQTDPERVFKNVLKSVPEFNVHDILKLPKHTVQVNILGIDEPRPVPYTEGAATGDVMKAGVSFRFSPIGMTVPVVTSFAERLICRNGMVSHQVVREFTHDGGRGGPGEGDDVWQFFRKAARDAYRSIEQVVVGYGQMVRDEIPATERAAVLTAMLRDAGLGQRATEAIRAEAMANPPQNAYDVMNLVTWGATHVEESPVRVARAQGAAARFAGEDSHRRTCPTCRRG